MKITVNRSEFLSLIQTAQKFTSPRSTLPVLSNLLLTAEGNLLTIGATTLEIGYLTRTGCVMEGGNGAYSVTVPAKTMVELVSSYQEEKLVMEFNVGAATVKMTNGKSRSTVKGVDAKEFPPLVIDPKSSVLKVDRRTLLTLFKQAAGAISNDEARPTLTGVLFKFSRDLLTLYSADGFRAIKTWEKVKYLDDPKEFIVPGIATNRLMAAMKDNGNGVELLLSSNRSRIAFRFDDTIVFSQLIEGRYPDVEQIMPTSASFGFACKKSDIALAIKRGMLFNDFIVFAGSEDNTEVHLHSQSDEEGNSTSTVKISAVSKLKPFKFNGRYATDLIDPIVTQDIEILGTESTSVFVVKPLGEGMNYIGLIMPAQMTEEEVRVYERTVSAEE